MNEFREGILVLDVEAYFCAISLGQVKAVRYHYSYLAGTEGKF